MQFGGVVGAATSVVTQVAAGKGVNWGQVGKEAAVGAVSGAVSGLAGPGAGLLVHAAVGAASGAAGQMVGNLIDHKPVGEGVAEAALIGGVTGVATAGAGKLLQKFGGKAAKSVETAAADACGLSFSSDTPVATPDGAKAIGDLKVGDTVQAYDPATKKPSTQTVQNVFINHDNDLIDVTLQVDNAAQTPKDGVAIDEKQRDAAIASHGSHAPPYAAETIHTTEKHPWLTVDKGWVKAGDLYVGDHVQRLDGTTATIVKLLVVPGEQDMYDLTVSNIHTFAVGEQQVVVHNCNNLPQLAQARADEIKNIMVKKTGWWFKVEATVGVAYTDTGTKIVSINETALTRWERSVSDLLQPDEQWVSGVAKGPKHAEELLVEYAKLKGNKILGLGASAAFCGPNKRNCAAMLLRELGQTVLGQVVKP